MYNPKKTNRMSKKNYLYYGTEESAFEPFLIGEFGNKADAQAAFADTVEKEISEGFLPSTVREEMSSDYWEGTDTQDYVRLYIVGTKKECLDALAEARAEFYEDEDW